MSRTDAWNKAPQTPIGAVYLRRAGEKTVQALNVVCPHAGCFVDYNPAANGYSCPCHNSTFKASDGARLGGPAPRGLYRFDVTAVTAKTVEIGAVEEDVLLFAM